MGATQVCNFPPKRVRGEHHKLAKMNIFVQRTCTSIHPRGRHPPVDPVLDIENFQRVHCNMYGNHALFFFLEERDVNENDLINHHGNMNTRIIHDKGFKNWCGQPNANTVDKF